LGRCLAARQSGRSKSDYKRGTLDGRGYRGGKPLEQKKKGLKKEPGRQVSAAKRIGTPELDDVKDEIWELESETLERGRGYWALWNEEEGWPANGLPGTGAKTNQNELRMLVGRENRIMILSAEENEKEPGVGKRSIS